MLTEDDLQAIGELIKPLQEGQDQIRREMLTKSSLELNNSVLGTIFKVELATLAQEVKAGFQTVATGFQEMGKKLKEVKEEIHSERLNQIEERLTKLEKQQSHPHS